MYIIFPASYIGIAILLIIILAAGIGIALYKVFGIIMWLTIAFIIFYAVICLYKVFTSSREAISKFLILIVDVLISIVEELFTHYLFTEIINLFAKGHLTSALEGLVDVILGIPIFGIILLVGSCIIFAI